MAKYPYISDKKLYAAVMGACKWIRESGYFNKATKYYADKYDLDVDVVREEVRKRQSAGSKGKSRGKYKNYRFKGYCELYRRESFYGYNNFDVTIKAMNRENAIKKLDEKVFSFKIDAFEDDIRYEFEINGEEI